MEPVQLARRNYNSSQLYVVATDKNVESSQQGVPRILRINPDAPYNEKIMHITSLCTGFNAYEIGEGMTVQGGVGIECLRDYAILRHNIPNDFYEMALAVRDRRTKELKKNYF